MYYKQVNETGKIVAFGENIGGTEITEAEYNRLLSEIRAKAAHVDAVYADPAKIDAVPPEWREEVQKRVEERRQAEQEAAQADISPAELGTMMEAIL